MFDDFKNIKKPFADDKEIEKYFEIPTSTQKSWRNSGIEMPHFRVKDTIKYPRQQIAWWFEQQIKNKIETAKLIDKTDSNRQQSQK